MMRELGPPLQSAAMTMLWVNGGPEVAEGQACKTQSLYYASNPNVAKPRVKGLRISMLQAELRSVLTKKRTDDADDDSGLPRSPATPPAGPLHSGKGQTAKSGGSCSDGSMLSIYSSGTGTGTDDDIFGPLSENSSRLSLSRDQDSLELRPAGVLSHAAAKHRIAVRPRRNHGVSRPRRPGRPGPLPASVPATVEEEGSGSDHSPPVTTSPTQDIEQTAQGLPEAGPQRGRATLPATGAAEKATPVQRSRSTIADRRLRDLSPRKLWARDASEPAPEKKSEGFFSRLFGSRRSGRKRKVGVEETPRPPLSADASQEERVEQLRPRPPGTEPVPVTSGQVLPVPAAEVTGATDRAESVVAENRRLEQAVAAAPPKDMKETSHVPMRDVQRPEEDRPLANPPSEEKKERKEEEEEVVARQESSQESSEARARPRSLLQTGPRSVSQDSVDHEPAESPLQPTPSAQESQSLESASGEETLTEAAPEQEQQNQKEQDQDQEESPPVLRRRRATPERSADRPSQTQRVSGGQKLSWMEGLRKTPPLDGSASSDHELRKTFVKEVVKTPSTGDEEGQRTPSWLQELRKTPSGHELRKTWVKEQPITPPPSEETKKTPPWVKAELRKSTPPVTAAVEGTPRTPPWVTEELQRASVSAGDPSPAVPVRPSRVRPGRRPVSSADPTLPSPSTGPSSDRQPSAQTGADTRRRASALVLGVTEPPPPPDSGPRSLDSAVLLTADRREQSGQRRAAPAADPAVSTADGVRLGAAVREGSQDRLRGARDSVVAEQGSVEMTPDRPSAADVSTSGSSESVGKVKMEMEQAEKSEPVESSVGRSESGASIGEGSFKSGSKSPAQSLDSLASDSSRSVTDPTTTGENFRRSLTSLTPDRPEVPVKPRKVSETESPARTTDTSPSTPAGESCRLSPVEKTTTSEAADKTPEFMKIHLHRVETPSSMTTQVVVPKAKPTETPLKSTWQTEQKGKEVQKAEEKVDDNAKTKVEKVEAKPDHKFDGLAGDVREVVLIENHSPRQPRCNSQANVEDHPDSNVKPASEAPASPKSSKSVPEAPSCATPSPAARTPDSSRQSSLGRPGGPEPEDSEPVVLRRRPPPADSGTQSSPDSELLKVFKRRSLKAVSPAESLSTPTQADDPLRISTEGREADRPKTELVTAADRPKTEPMTPADRPKTEPVTPADRPKTEPVTPTDRPKTELVTAPASRPVWSQRSISMPTGGLRSPSVREAGPPSLGPVTPKTPSTVPETPSARPDRLRKPVPPTQPRSSPTPAATDSTTVEQPWVKSTPDSTRVLSAASASAGPSGDPRRSVQAEEDEAPAADWLRLVRERREQREQREQQTMRKLGHKELIIEPDTLPPARVPAPRSSRVLEMANTFQKLQPT